MVGTSEHSMPKSANRANIIATRYREHSNACACYKPVTPLDKEARACIEKVNAPVLLRGVSPVPRLTASEEPSPPRPEGLHQLVSRGGSPKYTRCCVLSFVKGYRVNIVHLVIGKTRCRLVRA